MAEISNINIFHITQIFLVKTYKRDQWNLPNILAYISGIFDGFFKAGLVPLTDIDHLSNADEGAREMVVLDETSVRSFWTSGQVILDLRSGHLCDLSIISLWEERHMHLKRIKPVKIIQTFGHLAL